jgi:hypothetical protein
MSEGPATLLQERHMNITGLSLSFFRYHPKGCFSMACDAFAGYVGFLLSDLPDAPGCHVGLRTCRNPRPEDVRSGCEARRGFGKRLSHHCSSAFRPARRWEISSLTSTETELCRCR